MGFLTTDDLAERWRCSRLAVADAIRAGDLPATKIAGRWLVSEDDAATYQQSRMNVAPVKRRTRRPRTRGVA